MPDQRALEIDRRKPDACTRPEPALLNPEFIRTITALLAGLVIGVLMGIWLCTAVHTYVPWPPT